MTEVSYFLAVDVGTSRIAAATARVAPDGSIVTAPFALGRKSDSVATVVFVGDDGELSFGDAAERRGVTQPERLIREFKRSIGDEIPLVVGGRSLPAEQLYAQTVAAIVDLVTEREGRRPEAVSVSHPTAWGGHRIELIRSALRREGIDGVELITEPEAAARHYEASRSLQTGQTLAVYDLGGGTFDSVILRKEPDGTFDLIGEPVGIDDLGGADFDDAVMRHVIGASGLDVAALAMDDPAVRLSLAQLRRECVDAKEALSFDSEATIPVVVPPTHTSVRLTRSEFEDMVTASLDRTMDALDEAIETAGIEPEQLESILLIGGSSRIPHVAQRLSERFDRPIAIDADPKAAIALGAARTALIRLNDSALALTAGAALALVDDAPAAAEVALWEEESPAAPTAPQPPAKAHRSSPFVLGGAAVMIAAAIVFASTLSAGSGTADRSPLPTTSSTAATPTAEPAAAAPAAAAPDEKADEPAQKTGANPNPRRSATPKARAPQTAKPTTPPSATAAGQGGTSSGTTPTKTTPGGTTPGGTTDPGTTPGGTTDPGTTPGGTTDPGTTDPGTTDPGTTDPGTTDPGETTDPGGTTDPGETTDPGGTTDPGETTDPGGTTDPSPSPTEEPAPPTEDPAPPPADPTPAP